jgi:hypothetical protein
MGIGAGWNHTLGLPETYESYADGLVRPVPSSWKNGVRIMATFEYVYGTSWFPKLKGNKQ